MSNSIRTIDELKDVLSKPEDLIKSEVDEFHDLAEDIINNFQIKKGDKRYWMTDIEFYVYSDSHRDIITYPRNCEAGRWFFHASGVDLSFKSKVIIRSHPKSHKQLPFLTEEAVFGGILLRGITPVDHLAGEVAGPMKVCDELFDHFDAFRTPTDFPRIVAALSPRNVTVNSAVRYGLNPSAEKKIRDLLSYNYSGHELTEDVLIEEYGKYREKGYRFQAKP